MRIEKTVSKYAVNSVASSKKHIYARLLDYFLTFIVSTTLFAILLPISSNVKLVIDANNNLTQAGVDFNDFVDSTHLLRYNEGKTSINTINQEAEQYMFRLAKTSAYVHGIDFPVKQDDGTYIYVPVNKEETFIQDLDNYPMDNLSYYINKYKSSKDELNDYNGKTYSECSKEEIEHYLFINLMSVTISNYVTSGDTDYLNKGEGVAIYNVLTVEKTNKLLLYYSGDKADISLYNSIYNSYANGVQKCIKEVENKSKDYLRVQDQYLSAYNKVSLIDIVVFYIGYFLAYVLLVLIISLINKEWTTIGTRTMKLAFSDKDEMNPPIWKHVVYHLLSFIGFTSTSILTFLLINMFGITSLTIVGPISYLMLMLFVLPFNLVSLFMPLFTKNRYDLATFATGLIIKDKKEFDVPVGVDILDKVEDGREQKD